jgi:NAD+ kinase
MTVKVKTVALFASRSSPECVKAWEELRRHLRTAGFEVIDERAGFDPTRVDAVVLLGGDGFLMESVHALGFPPTPIFGINFGSVGFLMNPKVGIEEIAAMLREGRFLMEEHPVLEARVNLVGGREERVLALNDFVMERTGGQGVRLRVLINRVLLNEFSGDGVIVATSAGSTAYNLAAGGPVFHPRISGMALTPLYPHRAAPFHSLQFSVLLPLDSRVDLVGGEVEKRPIRFLADGRLYDGASSVTVRDSGLRIRLLRVESHEFVATLARKFIGPG